MRNDIAGANSMPSARPWPRRDNSDEALIGKIAAGNRLALQVLYARHHTRIYRFLLRLTDDAALAEDLTGEVFASAWRHAHRFEGQSAVSTWLIAIARRKAEIALRRQPAPALHERSETASPGKPRGDRLRDALARLKREHREIIDLVYYHQRSVQDVADVLGIPSDAVQARMIEARRELRQLLQAPAAVGAQA
jgi:RNA polymerase sigma-70 factor, ECF subfamily